MHCTKYGGKPGTVGSSMHIPTQPCYGHETFLSPCSNTFFRPCPHAVLYQYHTLCLERNRKNKISREGIIFATQNLFPLWPTKQRFSKFNMNEFRTVLFHQNGSQARVFRRLKFCAIRRSTLIRFFSGQSIDRQSDRRTSFPKTNCALLNYQLQDAVCKYFCFRHILTRIVTAYSSRH